MWLFAVSNKWNEKKKTPKKCSLHLVQLSQFISSWLLINFGFFNLTLLQWPNTEHNFSYVDMRKVGTDCHNRTMCGPFLRSFFFSREFHTRPLSGGMRTKREHPEYLYCQPNKYLMRWFYFSLKKSQKKKVSLIRWKVLFIPSKKYRRLSEVIWTLEVASAENQLFDDKWPASLSFPHICPLYTHFTQSQL